MDSGILILIGTLGGAFIGAISTLGVTWLSKRTEERKHYRELIINLAIENYKEERLMARTMIEKRPQVSLMLYPLDGFIIHMTRLADLVVDKKIQPDEVKKLLSELDELIEKVYEYYDERESTKKNGVSATNRRLTNASSGAREANFLT